MMRDLGGPHARDAILARHQRYMAADPDTHGLFAVVVGSEREPVGWVGFWETESRGEAVWECGWSVVPEHQGRGVGSSAVGLMLEEARMRERHRWMYAYPSVDNAASNALCRALGFELLGETEVEYPAGSMMRSNDWRLDLTCG